MLLECRNIEGTLQDRRPGGLVRPYFLIFPPERGAVDSQESGGTLPAPLAGLQGRQDPVPVLYLANGMGSGTNPRFRAVYGPRLDVVLNMRRLDAVPLGR